MSADKFRTCPHCGRLLLGIWSHDCTPAEPSPYLDGHCSPHDQYHALCPYEYRTPLGVDKRCSCPNHEERSAD